MFLTILFTVVLFLSTYFFHKRSKKNDKLPPAYPGELPIIGHAHLLIGNTAHLWRFVKRVQEHNLDNGKVTYVKLGSKIQYAISDPEDCTKVANVCLEKSHFYRTILSSWVGQGLVTASVPVWKRHRKVINPAFKQQVLEGFLGIFNSHARLLADNLSSEVGKTPFDTVPYLDKAFLEANFRIAFGAARDDEDIDMKTYIKSFKEVTYILLQRHQHLWMHSNFLFSFSKLKKKQDDAIKTTSEVSFKIIKSKKCNNFTKPVNTTTVTDADGKFRGFLDLILEQSQGTLTDSEIREELDTAIFAGYDTSATTLVYLLTVLGSYSDVQERAFAEIQEVFGRTYRDVVKEDLLKLVYLEGVVKETLRLYPIVPIIIRELDQDVQLENYTLKAGNDCLMLIYATNRHPVWGEDREVFKPERWLDPSKLPENPNSFAGFGIGRRSCIGKAFAMMFIKTALVHILRQFKITSDVAKLDRKLEILTKPTNGHHITLERRIAAY